MSPAPRIRVRDLWKEYSRGVSRSPRGTLYDQLGSLLRSPLRRLRSLRGGGQGLERFWALREIDFEVGPGEVVGVIGRNGAGKSTLLKVLSRITAPTRGRIEVRGRVASLLEVGTGFHPELSGRENVYLNGAILGMARREIDAKFDEIVAFAEIEPFLDTPVKRYSSGMYVRLAFAVAAHVDPDVLVVDEVLAVGDASFQRKCLDKMGRVGGEGRTVLFVSHNMAAVSRLCQRGLLLDGGRCVRAGAVAEVIESYLGDVAAGSGLWSADAEGDYRWLRSARLVGADGETVTAVRYDEPFEVELEFVAAGEDPSYVAAVKVTSASGIDIFSSSDLDSLAARHARPGDRIRERCQVPAGLLRPGSYVVTPMILQGRQTLERSEAASLTLEVSAAGFPFELTRWGVITPRLTWTPAGSGRNGD